MEVLLQYWDDLDDAYHSLRFMVLRSRLAWSGVIVATTVLGSCANVL